MEMINYLLTTRLFNEYLSLKTGHIFSRERDKTCWACPDFEEAEKRLLACLEEWRAECPTDKETFKAEIRTTSGSHRWLYEETMGTYNSLAERQLFPVLVVPKVEEERPGGLFVTPEDFNKEFPPKQPRPFDFRNRPTAA